MNPRGLPGRSGGWEGRRTAGVATLTNTLRIHAEIFTHVGMDALVAEVNTLRQQYRELAAAHSQLLTQQNECTAVLKELKILEEDAKIYKSTGPVLTTQSKDDAINTISKRIEYINGEVDSKAKAMSSLQANIEEKCKKLDAMNVQQRRQQNS